MKETCYMCDDLATGREHVPPRGLFPKLKDLPGTNYRESLITVPACDRHNSEKSKEDEYLMAILPVYLLNNPVAGKHIDSKVLRALKRRPKLATNFVEDGGVLGNGLAYMGVDSGRVFNACDHIARGLYYHQLTSKWAGLIEFSSPALFSEETPCDSLRKHSSKEAEINDWFQRIGLSFQGENKEIFQYRIFRVEGLLAVQLVFYGGLCVSGIGKSKGEF